MEHTTNPYARRSEDAREPPSGWRPTLKFLGPSLILAGSVVGSGEIILTTTLGAAVGFAMLWWVLLSCWSQSVLQAELGRVVISSGETGIRALNHVPGKLGGVSWVVLVWLFILIPGHLAGGGIYGSVGQAVHLALPGVESKWWTLLFAGIGVGVVLSGTYRFIEKLLTVMVVSFTLLTLVCAVLLQYTEYALSLDDLRAGLSFEFPPSALAIALAVFGATGITANENIAYTYWCTEKGYARFAGPTDTSDAWVTRAKGWIRVPQIDVWLNLVVLTLSTVPFYMLGAGVLHRMGEKPDGLETLSLLSNMYTETLGEWAFWLFMIGAFFVLFSTLVAALAGTARTFADCMIVLRVIPDDDYPARVQMIRAFTVLSPVIMTLCYFTVQNPVWLLTVGGVFYAALSPIVAGGVIYLRYRRTDPRLAPSRQTDLILWACFLAILGVAGYVLYLKLAG
jgi:manganese transport protein